MNTQTAIERFMRTTGKIDPVNDRSSHKRVQAVTVRQMCGDISDMTLWRWLDNSDLNFPKPIYIGRRRYWREADVILWLEAQSGEAA